MSKSFLNKLKNTIQDYLPNDQVQFNANEMTGDLQIVFTKKKKSIMHIENNTLNEIKHYVDLYISNKKRD